MYFREGIHIYTRGLKSEDLVAMVDFLYFGEANVYQENLDSFLAMAEELQLKGLMGSDAKGESEYNIKQPAAEKKTPKQVQPKSYIPQEAPAHDMFDKVDKVEPEPPLEGTVAVTDYTVAADLQDLDANIKSMMETTERTMVFGNSNRAVMVCKVCGKEGPLQQIQRHIEAHHITGISHNCNICGKTSRSRNALQKHNSRNHGK